MHGTETPFSERQQLFVKKLQQCCVMFDFNDASAELRGKQIKAQTLHELLEYITTQRNVITESLYPEVVHMASLCGLASSFTASNRMCSIHVTCSALYPHR